MVHEEDGVAWGGGDQPHGGTDAVVRCRVYGLLDAAAVLRVLGLCVALAEVQGRYSSIVRRLLRLAAGEARGTIGADKDRSVGEGLYSSMVVSWRQRWYEDKIVLDAEA